MKYVLVLMALLAGCSGSPIKPHGMEGDGGYAAVAEVAKSSVADLPGAVHGPAPPSVPGHDAGQKDGHSGRIK
jgi:hypothetical protein